MINLAKLDFPGFRIDHRLEHAGHQFIVLIDRIIFARRQRGWVCRRLKFVLGLFAHGWFSAPQVKCQTGGHKAEAGQSHEKG